MNIYAKLVDDVLRDAFDDVGEMLELVGKLEGDSALRWLRRFVRKRGGKRACYPRERG